MKWVLKRLLSGSRPDLVMVAKELGMSHRTLQRRITTREAPSGNCSTKPAGMGCSRSESPNSSALQVGYSELLFVLLQ